jgi:hypothetical protein
MDLSSVAIVNVLKPLILLPFLFAVRLIAMVIYRVLPKGRVRDFLFRRY